MSNLPASILEYYQTLIFEQYSLAYLLTDKDGCLIDAGGSLTAYGVTNLQQGKPIAEQVFFLEGLLPLEGANLLLPCVKIENKFCADIHLFSKAEGDWTLLLNSTTEESQQSIQQSVNNLSLFRYRQFKHLTQLFEYLFAEIERSLNLLEGNAMSESILGELLVTLNILVLERSNDGLFAAVGVEPNWFQHFFPDPREAYVQPQERFLFLENFIVDAEQIWQNQASKLLKSGLWTETDASENEWQFEASAVNVGDRHLLLIELLEVAYQEKQSLIQTARANKLIYENFVKEAQKKEILLHCILHDLSGQLTAINCCLALLADENLSPKGKERLAIGERQVIKQGNLIREILDAFSADIETFQSEAFDPDTAPDIVQSAREVVDALLPTFMMNRVRLQLNFDLTQMDWQVIAEKSRLERIFANLIENALRYSPAGSTVIVDLKTDENHIVATVEDQGSGVPPAIVGNLFKKFFQGQNNPGKAGLGLYFCRITIERWGGSIGYLPCLQGGAQFWFRLPKLSASR
jgi:signal transduction histidine kinase